MNRYLLSGGGGDLICEDLWGEILKALPLKTLCRLKCVCKSWNSLIIPSLINNRNFSGNKSYIIFSCYSSRYVCLAPAFHHAHPTPVSSLLWNPTTSRYVEIPANWELREGNAPRLLAWWRRVIGFGFNNAHGEAEFKVVRCTTLAFPTPSILIPAGDHEPYYNTCSLHGIMSVDRESYHRYNIMSGRYYETTLLVFDCERDEPSLLLMDAQTQALSYTTAIANKGDGNNDHDGDEEVYYYVKDGTPQNRILIS